jgi:hypothetical protein
MRARRWTAEDMRSVMAHDRFHQDIKEDEMRRAAKGDGNRHELVEAMKRIGARVYPIGKPLDYLVTFRKRTLLVEIKNPLGRNRLTKEQEEFIASWDGEIHVCSTIDEAVNAVVNGWGIWP